MRARRNRPTAPGLMRLADALEALGDGGPTGLRYDDIVPVAQIVGTMARASDFDEDFRLVNRSLQPRWQRLANGMAAGMSPAPIELVQLGGLYFVVDGHHRVSVARSLGWDSVAASVSRICTIAYAMCCLRSVHMASKAAERRFLERIPLPDELRPELWLDEPAGWARLADAAEAWGYRQARSGRLLTEREQLAVAWWEEEVTPVLQRLRADADPGLRDVQLYANALGAQPA